MNRVISEARDREPVDEGAGGAGGPDAPAAPNPELLIKGARRRQRRRWAATLAATAAAAGLVAGLLLTTGRGRNAVRGGGAVPRVVSVRSVSFPGPFVPLQVVSARGRAWVLGTNQADYRQGCRLEAIDPATLRSTPFPLPACGYYLTVANGLIYVAGAVPSAVPGDEQVHLEVLDPATGGATLMAPPVMTTQGSSRAHMAMAYQGGWIWISEWGSSIWQVSPSTGRVVRTITDAPPSPGGHGIIVGNRSGLWATPGLGGPPTVYRLEPGATAMSRVYTGPRGSMVSWLAPVGDMVWAALEEPTTTGGTVTTRLVAFDPSGRQVVTTPTQQFGDVPLVGSPSQAWSVGSGPDCAAPQRLWFVDPKSGRSTPVATLATPIEPCLTENPTASQTALVGDRVVVLEPTGVSSPPAVLHVIRTASGR